mgnify:CR=1 FL=1
MHNDYSDFFIYSFICRPFSSSTTAIIPSTCARANIRPWKEYPGLYPLSSSPSIIRPWSTRMGSPGFSFSKIRIRSIKCPRPVRWELSMKFPPGMAAVLRKCTKWVRLANFFASSQVSLCSPALKEPAQKVSPLCELSTAFKNHSISLSLVTMRGNPRTWNGGSSGCYI